MKYENCLILYNFTLETNFHRLPKSGEMRPVFCLRITFFFLVKHSIIIIVIVINKGKLQLIYAYLMPLCRTPFDFRNIFAADAH